LSWRDRPRYSGRRRALFADWLQLNWPTDGFRHGTDLKRASIPISRNAFRLLALALALTFAGATSASAAPLPATAKQSVKKTKKAKRCKASEVKRTFSYTRGKSKRKYRFSGCVPRSYSKRPVSVQVALGRSRKIAAKLAPKSIARLFGGRAARRVSGADAVTDRALARALVPVRAATVGHAETTEGVTGGPPGTTSTEHNVGTNWDSSEPNPGTDVELTTDTTGQGSTKRAVIKLTRTMAQCPDAGGIGHGVLKFSQKETKTVNNPGGGRGVTVVTLSLDAQVLVHFDDEAHVSSPPEVIGEWNWDATTSMSGHQLTHHAVGGTHSGTANPDGHGESITTATTNASSPGMVVYGDLFGATAHMITEGIVQELVRESAGRASGGACAHLVPEPQTVHVKPGTTVAIAARLTEAPRSKPVKAGQGSAGGAVAPAEADANPVATFTYFALSVRPPGGTDTVTFTHVSKQGRAVPKTVTIIYDEMPFPNRYEGTWTRIITVDDVGTIETIHGTAVYVRNPLFGPELNGQTSIPYDIESASVTWTMSGSHTCTSCNPECTRTYGGSGSEPFTDEWRGPSLLTIEEVSRHPDAPKPEPNPYYYAIEASPGAASAPQYDISGCGASSQADIDTEYLAIGHRGELGASTPLDEIVKSQSATLLEGHLVHSENTVHFDDTWHFTGSGSG
jgi:hypothetical protein